VNFDFFIITILKLNNCTQLSNGRTSGELTRANHVLIIWMGKNSKNSLFVCLSACYETYSQANNYKRQKCPHDSLIIGCSFVNRYLFAACAQHPNICNC
jgi:hypothetical protein